MLFRTLVLLTAKVNLLMKGVTPAVWPVIVIVVSSASLAPASWEKTMMTAPTMINEHVFIGRLFFIGVFFENSAERVRAGRSSPARTSMRRNSCERVYILTPECRMRSTHPEGGCELLTPPPILRGSYQRQKPSLFGILQQSAN